MKKLKKIKFKENGRKNKSKPTTKKVSVMKGLSRQDR